MPARDPREFFSMEETMRTLRPPRHHPFRAALRPLTETLSLSLAVAVLAAALTFPGPLTQLIGRDTGGEHLAAAAKPSFLDRASGAVYRTLCPLFQRCNIAKTPSTNHATSFQDVKSPYSSPGAPHDAPAATSVAASNSFASPVALDDAMPAAASYSETNSQNVKPPEFIPPSPSNGGLAATTTLAASQEFGARLPRATAQPLAAATPSDSRSLALLGAALSQLYDQKLAALDQSLRQLIFQNVSYPGSLPASGGVVNNIALSQKIDQLSGTTITNPTITGGSITAASIAGTLTNAVDATLATITNLTATELVATNATTTNLAVTAASIGTLSATSATTTALYASSLAAPSAAFGALAATSTATSTFTGGVSLLRLSASATSTLSGLVVDGNGLRLSNLDCTSYANGGALTTDADGNIICSGDDGGAGGSVGGANTQIQFNDAGSFGASANLTFDKTTGKFSVPNASTTNISSSYASSTQGFFGSLSIGALSGFLKATAGSVATSLVNLASDVTGVAPVANGGTGWANIAAGAIPYGNGAGALATTSAGTAGSVLALIGGIPTWTATTTFTGPLAYANGTVSIPSANGSTNGYLSSSDWTTFNSKQAVLVSGTNIKTVNGTTLLGSGDLVLTAASSTLLSDTNVFSGSNSFTTTITGSISGNAGTATALQNARTINGTSFDGTQNITITAASSTLLANANTWTSSQTFSSAPTLSTLSGLLKGNGASAVTAAQAGVDYVSVANLAAAFPFAVQSWGNSTSTTVGFSSGIISNASSTFASALYLSSLASGALAVDANHQVYKAATTTFSMGLTYQSGAVTCDTASGSVFGCLSAADWTTFNSKQAALGFTPPPNTRAISTTYPLQGGGDLSADRTLSLAFGTTTANSWSQLQTFSNGFLTLASSTIGNGTQVGGLTIAGGATTTGMLYITPPSNTVTKGLSVLQTGPTNGVGNASGINVFNQIYIGGVQIDAGALPYPRVIGNYVHMVHGGSNSSGTSVALETMLDRTAADSARAWQVGYDDVSAVFTARSSSPNGGTDTSTGAAGTLFGISPVAQANAGATNLLEVSGMEVDVGIYTGGSSRYKFGASIVDIGNLPAAELDSAVEIGAVSSGWKTGFLLANIHGTAPLASTGCVLCTDGSANTIAKGIDLSAYTITDSFLRSPNFVVMGSGRVGMGAGIGTTGTSTAGLEVYGSGQTTAALADSGLRGDTLALNSWSTDAGSGGVISFGNYQSHIKDKLGFSAIKGLLTDGSNNTAGDLAFSTRNVSSDNALTERMRIASGGNVGIGTTNPASFKLQVAGNIGPETNTTYDIGSTALRWGCIWTSGGSTGTCASDERLKDNIADVAWSGDPLTELAGLRPRTFTFKDDPNHTQTYGLIAQEAEQVAPELVVTDASTTLKKVKYGAIQWLVFSAVQELIAKVSNLSDTVAGFADHFTTRELTFTRATGDEIDVKRLKASEVICLGATCITETQLAALLGQSAASGLANPPPDPAEPPTIEIQGNNPAHINVGDSYNDLGARITGPTQADTNLGIHLYLDGAAVPSITLDTQESGEHMIDYVATNAAGTSTSTRTVIIEAPEQPTPAPEAPDAPPSDPEPDNGERTPAQQ